MNLKCEKIITNEPPEKIAEEIYVRLSNLISFI